MANSRAELSANEAASVTGVPLKQVHRIIDAGLLDGAVDRRDGGRVVFSQGLVGLKLVHETADLLTLEGRRRLVRHLLEQPNAKTVREDAVQVDLRAMDAAVRRGLSRLEKSKKLVITDEGVLGGTPCVKGSRVPVHDIAEMVANGDDTAAVLSAYPRISSEQLELAVIYARAYPRRGRPRRKPSWRKRPPTSSEEIQLDETRRDP